MRLMGYREKTIPFTHRGKKEAETTRSGRYQIVIHRQQGKHRCECKECFGSQRKNESVAVDGWFDNNGDRLFVV